MDEPSAVPYASTHDDPLQKRRRDLLAALLVERFTPYRPPSAADRSRKGAA